MSDPIPFRAVLEDELTALIPPAERASRSRNLSGLALSGGGIRSATFNLGVIQALLAHRQLSRFDYLSTVSGGGYIGSWLSALIKRLGQGDVGKLEAAFDVNGDGTVRARFDAAVHFLRRYSNYLTPRLGIFGADMMTAVSIYWRNLVLNLAMIALIFAGLVFAPYPITGFFSTLQLELRGWTLLVAALLIVLAAILVGLGSRPPRLDRTAPAWFEKPDVMAALIGMSLVSAGTMGSFALGAAFYNRAAIEPMYFVYAACGGALLTTLASGIAFLAWRIHAVARPIWEQERRSSNYGGLHESVLLLNASVVAGAVGGVLILGLAWLVADTDSANATSASPFLLTGFGGPALAMAAVHVMWIQSGLGKRAFTEQDREWHGRLTGHVMLVALVWAAGFAAFLGAAVLFDWIEHSLGRIGGFIGWAGVTIVGVLIARSRKTGGPDSRFVPELIARVAPWVFIVGMLVGLALADHWLVSVLTAWARPEICEAYRGISLPSIATCHQTKAVVGMVLLAAGVLAARLLGYFVDINLFAFHQFYRNRLARCYLGATKYASASSVEGLPIPGSTEGRRPHDATELDPDDDFFFKELGGSATEPAQRPYHIINATLNLAATHELAWQQRKAASFVFTPRHCGFQLPPQKDAMLNPRGVVGGFRPTGDYLLRGDGPRLGMALAISGAAVSPNSGYHTSPAVTFLLTVFNLRLGRWCGNPITPDVWQRPSPRNALTFLFRELRGQTTERSSFVYLSDGGHFENLGLYELVRRRCARIVVSDASADPQYNFEDLANAIRKVRVDFGVEITFDQPLEMLRTSDADQGAATPFVIGTIHYPGGNEPTTGTLFYLKPTLTSDITEDVANYGRANPDFPHETTVDQWFDESQFESYRKLGYILGTKLLTSARWAV